MNYKLMIGTSAAHVAIDSGTGELMVTLPGGKGMTAGLRQRADEFHEKAQRYARYAELCRATANHIEQENHRHE